MIKVTTQKQLDTALRKDPNVQLSINAQAKLRLEVAIGAPLLRVLGNTVLRLVARGSSQPHVEAWESSQPHVEAWESSQPHVEAWGSSQPHVVAWGSSQPHVVARGSSQPHVEAKAYAQVSLSGAGIKATAAANVAVLLWAGATVSGGRPILVRRDAPDEWCDYYGVAVNDGVAILYKALNEDFSSPHGTSYAPGSVPVAADWDGGTIECGYGLHFSPTPTMALAFHPDAKRFAGCLVRLADIAVHPAGQYPEKIKASGCCGPCFEVDRQGRPIAADEVTA